MDTRTLYYLAYSAARDAMHDELDYRSPMAAGLDATTEYRDVASRYHVVAAAARAAAMHGSYRRRVSMRVLLRPATSMKLMGLNARQMAQGK